MVMTLSTLGWPWVVHPHVVYAQHGAKPEGFKSSVHGMGIRTMKRTARSQLQPGDRLWGGRLWDIRQPMNMNLISGDATGRVAATAEWGMKDGGAGIRNASHAQGGSLDEPQMSQMDADQSLKIHLRSSA